MKLIRTHFGRPHVRPASKANQVLTFNKSIPKTQIEYVDQNGGLYSIGEEYLNEGVVGRTSRTDSEEILRYFILTGKRLKNRLHILRLFSQASVIYITTKVKMHE